MPIHSPAHSHPRSHGDGLHVGVLGSGSSPTPFVDRLLTGLARRGDAVTLLDGVRPSSKWLAERSLNWAPSGLITRRGAVRNALSNRRIESAARTAVSPPTDPARFDVLYVPWINTAVERPELFQLGPPVVVSCRGALITIAPWDPSRPGFRAGLTATLERADAVHCVSRHLRDEAVALGMDPTVSQVIPPGVDVATFTPSDRRLRPSSPLRVLAVGSLIWRKDYETALSACALARAKGVDLQLAVVGDGSDRQRVRFTIADLGLADQVTLLGDVPPAAVAAELRRADVFLHTSSSEGISNAVLEAMACGLAVITTDSGGMTEAVRDGIDGLVRPVRDVAGIAAALVELAHDPERRHQLGSAAIDRVHSRYTLAMQIDAFHDLLARVAGRAT